MTFRDLIVFSVVLGSLPFCLTRPYYGLLVFSWLGYMRAQDLTWGMARNFRFSLYVAFLMFIGWIFFEKRPFMRRDVRTFAVLALLIWIFVSIMWNIQEGIIIFISPVFTRYVDFIKVVAVALLTTGLVDSKARLWGLLGVIAFSLGFFGVKIGIWGVLTGGTVLQGPGGMLKDNNDLALALNMNLPILYYLAFSVKSRNLKLFLLFSVVSTAGAVILTTSRGGFLTLAMSYFLFTMKSNKKALGLSVGAVAVLILIIFIPERYTERLKTIKAPAEEASAKSRLDSWVSSWYMIQDHSMTGVGFNNYINLFFRYDINPDHRKGTIHRVAHNTYLQVWAESGTPAFFFFMLAIFFSLWRMRRLRRWNRKHRGPPWVTNFAHMIEVSLVAFLVGSTFLNRAHFDLLYHMIAVSVCLDRIAPKVVNEERPQGPRANHGKGVRIRSQDPFFSPSHSREVWATGR